MTNLRVRMTIGMTLTLNLTLSLTLIDYPDFNESCLLIIAKDSFFFFREKTQIKGKDYHVNLSFILQ